MLERFTKRVEGLSFPKRNNKSKIIQMKFKEKTRYHSKLVADLVSIGQVVLALEA